MESPKDSFTGLNILKCLAFKEKSRMPIKLNCNNY